MSRVSECRRCRPSTLVSSAASPFSRRWGLYCVPFPCTVHRAIELPAQRCCRARSSRSHSPRRRAAGAAAPSRTVTPEPCTPLGHKVGQAKAKLGKVVGHAHTVQLGHGGFGPLAFDLCFLFSEYIQILANSKICVGFIWTRKIMKQILLDRS
jgi:hypothetical protein